MNGTEVFITRNGGIEKMGLIKETAEFIRGAGGVGDWKEQIFLFSHYLSYLFNEKQHVCEKKLTVAVAKIVGVPYKKLYD